MCDQVRAGLAYSVPNLAGRGESVGLVELANGDDGVELIGDVVEALACLGIASAPEMPGERDVESIDVATVESGLDLLSAPPHTCLG